jgi:ribonuclease VapC
MIVDSSALVALILEEADSDVIMETLLTYKTNIYLSAANYLETCLVIDSKKIPALSHKFNHLIDVVPILIEPVTEQQVKLARAAHQKYGRASGSKAQLNFGDCFAYALAKERGLPLLYKGQDFIHTDVLQHG